MNQTPVFISNYTDRIICISFYNHFFFINITQHKSYGLTYTPTAHPLPHHQNLD
jgi:hypothetical protein